ncbi:hypothetical protein PROFUN_03839 [Planoprotostelium fungivorum]|uniref:DNA repair metallo-beta-lactamase domain-containing protein n=1 Tax=Planoprotostelium fungivorum TaxID=1890364 RepID=A0A2P6NIA9_9EUKA|nr:hypothetical protein PROFUN_03839 [Planoprotostelium fungivorum]
MNRLLLFCVTTACAVGGISMLNDPYYNITVSKIRPESHGSSETRGVADYTGMICALNGNLTKMAQYLDSLHSVQNKNASSLDYGRFPWYWTQKDDMSTSDSNANNFIASGTAYCLRQCGDGLKRVSPSTYQAALTSGRISILWMRSQMKRYNKYVPSYTNMYVSTIHLFVMWGTILGDDVTVMDGHNMLKLWINTTQTSGIAEYSAQTYIGMSIDMFQNLARNGPELIRQDALVALELVWRELTATYFSGAGYTGGSESRTYNYGYLPTYATIWFAAFQFPHWTTQDVSLVLNGKGLSTNPLDLFKQPDITPWGPSTTSQRYLQWPTKSYRGKFKSDVGADRSSWSSPGVSIGAGGYASAADVPVVGLFANFSMASLYVMTDDVGDPYCTGASRTTGHCEHPVNVRVNVQKGGTVLTGITWNNGTEISNKEASTNVIVPLAADEILINGRSISRAMNTSVDLPLDTIVSVRYKTGAIVFRILTATTGIASDMSSVKVKWIVEPGSYGGTVGRLAIFHRTASHTAAWAPDQAAALLAFHAKTVQFPSEVALMPNGCRNLSASANIDGHTLSFRRRLTHMKYWSVLVELARSIDGREDKYPAFDCYEETEESNQSDTTRSTVVVPTLHSSGKPQQMPPHRGAIYSIPGVYIDSFEQSKELRESRGVVWFLTHFHADHYLGLADDFDGIIHCTSITRDLVLNRFKKLRPSQIVILMDCGTHIIQTKTCLLNVQTLPTNHCPGAVMLLLDSGTTRVLHTGDIRYDADIFAPAMTKIGQVNTLYLDTTFLQLKWKSFPPAVGSFEMVGSIVEKSLKNKRKPIEFYIECEMLGTEELLVYLSERFSHKIQVRPSFYRKLKILYKERTEELFTCDDDTIFHACKAKTFFNMARRKENQEGKVFIKASTQWFGLERDPMKYLQTPVSSEGVWHVLYSIHSSMEELVEFVARVGAQKIVPLTDCDAPLLRQLSDSCQRASQNPKPGVFSQKTAWPKRDSSFIVNRSIGLNDDDLSQKESVEDIINRDLAETDRKRVKTSSQEELGSWLYLESDDDEYFIDPPDVDTFEGEYTSDEPTETHREDTKSSSGIGRKKVSSFRSHLKGRECLLDSLPHSGLTADSANRVT